MLAIIGIMAARGINQQHNVETLATISALETLAAQQAVTETQAPTATAIQTLTPTPCPDIEVNANETVTGPATITFLLYDGSMQSALLADGERVDFITEGWINYCDPHDTQFYTSLKAFINLGKVARSVK